MQPIRLMGDGYEPHVDRLGDRLTYSLPVDSGVVSFSFTFDIDQLDLDILLSDNYRRAVLYVIAHTLLQRSTAKGNDRFTQNDFDTLIANTLHSPSERLQTFISQVGRENHIVIEHYVKQVMSPAKRC
ncbi:MULTISPECIES: hypothetical protein [unclassified Pseudescherichia]|uniref:hypothetical protein n=1 Tax=unclassified Pseudescherichia TaxID=2620545 RepID=UPI0021502045|nr:MULTISPECIES: hypothetical protein [unclassified Pseudescherichia]MCR4457468.1 hypothetical protein [Pseudescherichia sp. L3]